MSHISFYRKYRPKKFAEVIGQNHVVITLKNEIKYNRIFNGYILSGPKGNGKTTIAKIFAKAMNCLQPIDGDCCEKCENCLLIDSSNCSDIIELDAASNNGVDEARNIVNNIKYLPMQLKKKVYIIDEAHMITTQGWNALLKTIEEIPQHAVFIFATTEFHKIPATIVSRCQYFNLNKFNEQELVNVIEKVIKTEHINISQEAKVEIIKLSKGHARDVLTMLEQIYSLSNGKEITVENVNDIFGLISIDKKIEFINEIIKCNVEKSLSLINFYYDNGINFEILCEGIITILIDKIIYEQTNDISLLKILTKENINSILLNVEQLFSFINVWEEKITMFKKNNNEKFYLEKIIFESMKIFSNQQNNVINDIPTAKISVDKSKNDELPNADQLFSLKEIKNEIKQDVEKELKLSNNNTVSNNSNFDSIFMSIADNSNLYHLSERKNDLELLKQNNVDEINFFVLATKIVVSSEYGAVIQFEDPIDAKLFNNYSLNADFINKINKIIPKPIIFIGFTKDKIKILAQEYAKNKKNGVKYDNIDITKYFSKNRIQKAYEDFLNK